jgi:hypothetical protein
MRKTRFQLLLPALMMMASLPLSLAKAQSTWNGGATPIGYFSASANWNTAPTSGGGNTLNFDGSIQLNATNDITLTSADQAINFNATASAFSIWGNAIRMGNIANNSSLLQTINAQLRANGGRTINAGTAGMQLSQPVGSTSTSGRAITKSGSGDLAIGSGTALSGGASYTVSAGRLIFTGASATSLGSAANGVSLTASGTTLQLNNSGTLAMGGAISTVSSSSVVLNNTGAATISLGTTIASGANLTGTGSLLGGTVTVNGGIAPGISGIGTISIVNLILGSTATTTMKLDRSAGQNADLISASGSVTDGGSLVINNTGASLLSGDSFNLFDGTLSGTFASISLPTLDAGLNWDTSQLYSTGIISVIPTPEPTTATLLGGSVILGLLARRRR